MATSFLAVVLSLVFTFILLPTSAEAQDAEKTIIWWYEEITPEQLEGVKKDLVEPFEEKYPNVDVKISVKQNLRETLRQAISAGKGPEIVMTGTPAQVIQYAKKDYLLPLDKYLEEQDAKIADFALNTGSYKGKTYAIPKTFESMGIFYNKSLFEKHGWEPPKTREEWVNLCENIKEKGITPVAAGNSDWRAANEWFVTTYMNHYAGPENYYKAIKGEKEFTDPIFVEAIKMLKKDFNEYWVDKSTYSSIYGSTFMPMIASRQAAMTIAGSWGFQWTGPSYWPTDDEIGWAPFPNFRDGLPYPIADVGVGTTLSVNKNSENPEAAARFLTWIMTYKPGIGQLYKDHPGEWLVPYEEPIPDEDIPDSVDPTLLKHIRTQESAIAEGRYGYTTWTFHGPQTWQWIYEGIEKVWYGDITPEEYLEKWEETQRKEAEENAHPPVPERG